MFCLIKHSKTGLNLYVTSVRPCHVGVLKRWEIEKKNSFNSIRLYFSSVLQKKTKNSLVTEVSVVTCCLCVSVFMCMRVRKTRTRIVSQHPLNHIKMHFHSHMFAQCSCKVTFHQEVHERILSLKTLSTHWYSNSLVTQWHDCDMWLVTCDNLEIRVVGKLLHISQSGHKVK